MRISMREPPSDGGVREFAGAERIGWLCYNAGNFAAARRWLARAPQTSPQALWLAGKLAARDGDRAASLRAFSAASRLLVREPEPALEITKVVLDENTPAETMAADHAIAAIGAAEFRVALEAFLRGGHLTDAASVAERLLSIGELRDFVAKRLWKKMGRRGNAGIDEGARAKPAGETRGDCTRAACVGCSRAGCARGPIRRGGPFTHENGAPHSTATHRRSRGGEDRRLSAERVRSHRGMPPSRRGITGSNYSAPGRARLVCTWRRFRGRRPASYRLGVHSG